MTIGLDLCSKKYILPRSAARHMIAVYRRGYGVTTDYEIAWVTMALGDLRVGDDA
jgi:hypothetical protein